MSSATQTATGGGGGQGYGAGAIGGKGGNAVSNMSIPASQASYIGITSSAWGGAGGNGLSGATGGNGGNANAQLVLQSSVVNAVSVNGTANATAGLAGSGSGSPTQGIAISDATVKALGTTNALSTANSTGALGSSTTATSVSQGTLTGAAIVSTAQSITLATGTLQSQSTANTGGVFNPGINQNYHTNSFTSATGLPGGAVPSGGTVSLGKFGIYDNFTSSQTGAAFTNKVTFAIDTSKIALAPGGDLFLKVLDANGTGSFLFGASSTLTKSGSILTDTITFTASNGTSGSNLYLDFLLYDPVPNPNLVSFNQTLGSSSAFNAFYNTNTTFDLGTPVAAVPEPNTWAMMFMGLAGLIGLGIRRRTTG